jgi:hypothetical protein
MAPDAAWTLGGIPPKANISPGPPIRAPILGDTHSSPECPDHAPLQYTCPDAPGLLTNRWPPEAFFDKLLRIGTSSH